MDTVRTIVVSEPVYQYALYMTERYMQGGVAPKELASLNDWWNRLTAAAPMNLTPSEPETHPSGEAPLEMGLSASGDARE